MVINIYYIVWTYYARTTYLCTYCLCIRFIRHEKSARLYSHNTAPRRCIVQLRVDTWWKQTKRRSVRDALGLKTVCADRMSVCSCVSVCECVWVFSMCQNARASASAWTRSCLRCWCQSYWGPGWFPWLSSAKRSLIKSVVTNGTHFNTSSSPVHKQKRNQTKRKYKLFVQRVIDLAIWQPVESGRHQRPQQTIASNRAHTGDYYVRSARCTSAEVGPSTSIQLAMMEKNNTDSMTTVQMKADYAASEIYSTASEAPPVGFVCTLLKKYFFFTDQLSTIFLYNARNDR